MLREKQIEGSAQNISDTLDMYKEGLISKSDMLKKIIAYSTMIMEFNEAGGNHYDRF